LSRTQGGVLPSVIVERNRLGGDQGRNNNSTSKDTTEKRVRGERIEFTQES